MSPPPSLAGDDGEERRLAALGDSCRRARSQARPEDAARAVGEAHDLIWAWLEKQRLNGGRSGSTAILTRVNRWAVDFDARDWPQTMAERYRDLAARYVETNNTAMAHECFEMAALLQPEDKVAAWNRHLTMAALLARSGTRGDLDAAVGEVKKAVAIEPSSEATYLLEHLETLRARVTTGAPADTSHTGS